MTLQGGTTPSTASLRFPMSVVLPQYGELSLSDGSLTIVFRNCRVARRQINSSGGGPRWQEVTIEDRRWLWASHLRGIYGEYNRISPPLGRQTNQESVQQLAHRLLVCMGESNVNVSAMPSNRYPSMVWEGANPAGELEKLCQDYNCIVGINQQDKVYVAPIGVGQFPSQDPRMMDYQYQAEPPVVPYSIVAEGGRFHIHHDLPLIPVGLEIDGSSAGLFVHIDDLSYTPARGWAIYDPANAHMNVDPSARRVASQHVWRTYQVGLSGTDTLNLPQPPDVGLIQFAASGGNLASSQQTYNNFFRLSDATMHRIMPLNESRAVYGNQNISTSPEVFGFYSTKSLGNFNSRPAPTSAAVASYTDCSSQVTDIFDLDKMPISDPIPATHRGLVLDQSIIKKIDYHNGRVKFNEPVYFYDHTAVSDIYLPAVLRLRCSFPIRDPQTMGVVSPQYWYQPGSSAANVAKLLKDSSIQAEYSISSSNLTSFVAAAQSLVASELAKYQITEGFSIPFKTFVFDVLPDGFVKAIQWDVSEGGEGTTHIDYGLERPNYYLTLNERQLSRLATYNMLIAREEERRAKRGISQVQQGAKRP